MNVLARHTAAAYTLHIASVPVTAGAAALALLALLIYAGIALPAVWSRNPERRKAAASVLRQILNTLSRRH
jgi:hypothetical protein